MSDDMLDKLRQLPTPEVSTRTDRSARAAYVAAFDDSPKIPLFLARGAVPAVLAGLSFVYLSWAITTASSLLQ